MTLGAPRSQMASFPVARASGTGMGSSNKKYCSTQKECSKRLPTWPSLPDKSRSCPTRHTQRLQVVVLGFGRAARTVAAEMGTYQPHQKCERLKAVDGDASSHAQPVRARPP